MLKTIVTDIYDFPTLIHDRNVYVDKTALLHRLISKVDGTLFFMSRPRRFGKSLMISTLEQVFKGERRLFKGLSIDRTNYDWQPYPVIRLDMSQVRAPDIPGYRSALCRVLQDCALKHGVDLSSEDNPGLGLGRLIDSLASSDGKVVILVDEYDAPIGGLLHEPELMETVRSLLHDFYLSLKIHSDRIRFLMMTGVSKFTKLSVFSGMNNLTDISMSGRYASLLGYTRDEIEHAFRAHVRAFAEKRRETSASVVRQLLDWYDCYRFSPESEVRVCNPVSVGRALQERRFDGFWDATGNATLIIERLRRARKTTLDIEGLMVRPGQLDVCDARRLPLEPLLYQGGYLTIDHVDPSGLLSLRVPNREVRQALDRGFVASLMQGNADAFTNTAIRLMSDLGDALSDASPLLQRVLTSVFAMVPHEWKLGNEAEAKRYFLLFLRMAGARINAEMESSNGRADAVLETTKTIFIFEFKYAKSARAALKQCHDRNYALPYAADTRRVLYVGVNYAPRSAAIETLTEPVNEPVNGRHEPVNEPTSLKVLSAIRDNPGQRRPFLLSIVGISEATMKRALARLIASNLIVFRGVPKTGGYYAIATSNS